MLLINVFMPACERIQSLFFLLGCQGMTSFTNEPLNTSVADYDGGVKNFNGFSDAFGLF